ncbi:MAG: cell division protein FtsX [Bacteroidetes bacterium]|nr:cell division protein FtsX [Bacteroidota bacterium]
MSENVSKHKTQSSSITTVVSLSLVLFTLGLLGLLILNTQKLSNYVKENISFQIILSDNITEADASKLQKTLDASDYTKNSEFITKEKAAEDLKKDLGEDFIGFLGYNPLLASININLNAEYANTDSIAVIETELLKNKKIKEVIYQKNLIATVNENVKKISLVILVFSFLLMIIALALINNTIRLSIYSKRFIIRTMQLVGATQGFIRRPFVLKGILHGIYGAIIAIVLLSGLLYLVSRQFPDIMQLQDTTMLLTLFGAVVLMGIVISGISTALAVRKYLRIKPEDLYY